MELLELKDLYLAANVPKRRVNAVILVAVTLTFVTIDK
jgi:hypothetical protein